MGDTRAHNVAEQPVAVPLQVLFERRKEKWRQTFLVEHIPCEYNTELRAL